jgi:exosortase A
MPFPALLTVGPVIIGMIVVYLPMLRKLVYDWGHDDNYSHGFLIVPIAAYLVWERRAELSAARPSPSTLGLLVVAISLMMLVAGQLGAELFLTRVSLIGVLAGAVLFLYGWEHLRVVWFPLAFLLLMIPIPAIIFNQIAFPLQLLASRFGETVLRLFDIPVLREGNVMTLANTQLEVAEACSGIRSLISLLTLGIVYGYFTDKRFLVRLVIALSTIPVAIVANGLRVAGTGIAAYHYGEEAAQGFFHEFSGWVVFVVSLAMVFVIQRTVLAMAPSPSKAVS